MVKVAIQATNPSDSSIRTWGLAVDNPPEGNWTKNNMIYQAQKQSGDLWQFDLPLTDGKHTLYFIVSQPPSMPEKYSGEILLDNTSFGFSDVDDDTISPMDINVSGGKVTRATGSSYETKPKDIGDGRWSTVSRGLGKVKTRLTSIDKNTWIKIIGTGVAITASVVVTVLAWRWRRSKKGFRR